MDPSIRNPRTFVRSVKSNNLFPLQIEEVMEEIRNPAPTLTSMNHRVDITKDDIHGTKWVILSFAGPHEGKNTLSMIGSGKGSLSDQTEWPSTLFAPTSLCYGLYRIDFEEDKGLPPYVVSFCWKGKNLPIYLRTKHTEYNHVIRRHLEAVTHVTLQKPEDLMHEALIKTMPPRRRKRSTSKIFLTKGIEITPEVTETIGNIRSDTSPFNWLVCGYDPSVEGDDSIQRLILIEKGMTGLYALKGIGGINTVLHQDQIMYIYLRVDIPLHHGKERLVSKYVLITWQNNGAASEISIDDDIVELSLGDPIADGLTPSRPDAISRGGSGSSLLRKAVAHVHGREIYRLFPHHVHFFASSLTEITEEAVRERLRRAVDNDCMLLRVVCIQPTGDAQPPTCIEVPFDATVAQLKQEISLTIGIPEERQRIVWFRQTEEFENDSMRSSHPIQMEKNELGLRKHIGIGHGDKIHVEDRNTGGHSILAKLSSKMSTDSPIMSLSAERRHEVQRGVEAREAELKEMHSNILDMIRKRAKRKPITSPQSSKNLSPNKIEPTISHGSPEKLPPPVPNLFNTAPEKQGVHTDDVADLQEQARLVESQNQYLEIPYDSIRILGGKENELGCGKAAAVYRGLWMSQNGAAEVAVKLFRYVRLTDKILKGYTQEVALLRKLKHPNIVLFIGACTNPKLMILTEYCSRKSLYEVIHSIHFSTIPWKFKLRMMLDASRGIYYLHSMRIIHRDIKSHNFLVDDDWRVKVADFGISKVLENDTNAFTQCGTTGWVAPEVLLDEETGYTFKADNWSFAIVMWEMIAGEISNPFIGMAPIKFYQQTINQGIRPDFPDGVDPDYVQLITECWASTPTDRPSFISIVERLENMLQKLGVSIELPPSFQGGYHHAVSSTS